MSGGRRWLGGLVELLRIGLRSGFRFSSPYWRWRRETAFGSDPGRVPSFRRRVAIILAYGRWVYDMKQLAKGTGSHARPVPAPRPADDAERRRD